MITCKTCTECNSHKWCNPFRGKLRRYEGIRFTADGFDCAMPVAIDQHSTCSYGCLYCFSNFLNRDFEKQKKATGKTKYKVGQWPLLDLEKWLDGNSRVPHLLSAKEEWTRKALKFGSKRKAPVQWGALGDPFDKIENQQEWALGAAGLFKKYNQPVRISTKGGRLLQTKEYLSALDSELFWVAFSLITIDDEILERVDKKAPNATERLAAMKALSKMGLKTSLRLRPAMPGISDSTKRHPRAWAELLEKAAEAGANAVCFEVLFVPGIRPAHVDSMFREIDRIAGHDLVRFYTNTSHRAACLRSSRAWKEDITFKVYEKTKELGMDFGISDPHWKELNDYGCCCGISPDDPVFGNWERENATNAVVEAKKSHERTGEGLVYFKDINPEWASHILLGTMTLGSGPAVAYRNKHNYSWSNKLRDTWNDLKSIRGPLLYFGGILLPHTRDENGDIVYKYNPVKRIYPKNLLWETDRQTKVRKEWKENGNESLIGRT